MSDIPANWAIRKVKLVDVKPMEDNPRVISDRNLAGMEASIARFGYIEPIVWNERTGHIIGGHQRHGVLKSKGVIEATMVVVDLSPDEEMAANLTLNNPKIEGTWDDTAISLMAQVEKASGQLFDSLNMDTLKESLEKQPPTPPKGDEDPPPVGLDVDSENDDNEETPELDTECPCCGHKWDVNAEDVSVEEVSE
jgi:hypothetical protein